MTRLFTNLASLLAISTEFTRELFLIFTAATVDVVINSANRGLLSGDYQSMYEFIFLNLPAVEICGRKQVGTAIMKTGNSFNGKCSYNQESLSSTIGRICAHLRGQKSFSLNSSKSCMLLKQFLLVK